MEGTMILAELAAFVAIAAIGVLYLLALHNEGWRDDR
jgi:hypothetical protein